MRFGESLHRYEGKEVTVYADGMTFRGTVIDVTRGGTVCLREETGAPGKPAVTDYVYIAIERVTGFRIHELDLRRAGRE